MADANFKLSLASLALPIWELLPRKVTSRPSTHVDASESPLDKLFKHKAQDHHTMDLPLKWLIFTNRYHGTTQGKSTLHLAAVGWLLHWLQNIKLTLLHLSFKTFYETDIIAYW